MSPVVSPPSLPCAVLYGANDLRIELRAARLPPPGYAQVAVMATGLCGSDLHYYQHGRNGAFEVQSPMVLGHESAGIVTAVGYGVHHLRVGDRVAIECGVNCNECKFCSDGRYNLCSNMSFCSSAKTFPHLDGTLQGRMNHPADLLHRLPESVSYEQAALAEPLSVVLHATRRSSLRSGQSVLVLGAGSVGLLACALAKSLGASRIVAVDINPARLKFALKAGFADQVFCLPPPSSSAAIRSTKSGSVTPINASAPARLYTIEEAVMLHKARMEAALTLARTHATNIKEGSLQSDGFDVVFECTGAESCVQIGINAACTGGKMMLIGMGAQSPTIPLAAATTREVDLLGVFRYANTYPSAIELLATGALDGIEDIITHRFPLREANKAFELMSNGFDEDGGLVVKVMIGPKC